MSGWLKQGMLAMIAGGIIMAATPGLVTAQSAGDLIKERRALMKNNSKNWKVIRAYLKGKGSAADVVKSSKKITANAAQIPGLFPKGTGTADGVGKTRAKAAIWMERKKFEAAANLKGRAESFTKLAMTGDMDGMKTAAKSFGKKGCGGCHGTFRAEKKKKK